ncbi:unnamed protein product [Caenorhabditis auriculariae]|uniref:Uncharacterized protein n=1 Tax=Caenorhabditis auriculariae TaxID=2777116 RepID=A0A8S1HF12_9PELO|nr:unnamed protein product [Caenorhabditis auriculariae]
MYDSRDTKRYLYTTLLAFFVMDLAPELFTTTIFYHEASKGFSIGNLGIFEYLGWCAGAIIGPGAAVGFTWLYWSLFKSMCEQNVRVCLNRKNHMFLVVGYEIIFMVIFGLSALFRNSVVFGEVEENTVILIDGEVEKFHPSFYHQVFFAVCFFGIALVSIQFALFLVLNYHELLSSGAIGEHENQISESDFIRLTTVQVFQTASFYFLPISLFNLSLREAHTFNWSVIAKSILLVQAVVAPLVFLSHQLYQRKLNSLFLEPFRALYISLSHRLQACFKRLLTKFRSNRQTETHVDIVDISL